MAAPVGSRTLSLLCRKARRAADNADVAATIRSFLVVDLSKLDPGWLTASFMSFLPRVPQGMAGDLYFACIEGEVEKAILPKAIEDDNDDAESQDASPGNATVEVVIDIKIRYGSWHAYPILAWYASVPAQRGPVREWNLGSGTATNCISALIAMRRAFDLRRHKPGCSLGFMDMPSTLEDWREFFRMWLFGPRKPTQALLHHWLRSGSRPASGQ